MDAYLYVTKNVGTWKLDRRAVIHTHNANFLTGRCPVEIALRLAESQVLSVSVCNQPGFKLLHATSGIVSGSVSRVLLRSLLAREVSRVYNCMQATDCSPRVAICDEWKPEEDSDVNGNTPRTNSGERVHP